MNPSPFTSSYAAKALSALPFTATAAPSRATVPTSICVTSKSALPKIATGMTPCSLLLKQLGSLPGLISISIPVFVSLLRDG